jgi:hypothetical protein
MFLICHGAATMITLSGDPEAQKIMREVCIKTCDKLLEHVEIFRSRS